MKRFILIILFGFISGLVLSQTSIYHTFPDSNAVWGMRSGCVEMSPGCYSWGYVKDYLAGDTMIGGNNYKIVNEFMLYMSGTECCFPPGNSGYGFLREDTAARKVYWRDYWMTADSLLYDFNLQVGDTIRGYLATTTCVNPLTIVSIDSVLIGSTYRKRFVIDTASIASKLCIIEGIGSTNGLTALHAGCWAGTTLNCFSVNDSIVYTNPDSPDLTPCGSLSVNINQPLQNSDHGLIAYPNPAQSIITVKSQPIAQPVQISIFTSQGDLVLEKLVQPDDCEIDIAVLPPGVYFLRADIKNVSPTIIKIIKQ